MSDDPENELKGKELKREDGDNRFDHPTTVGEGGRFSKSFKIDLVPEPAETRFKRLGQVSTEG